MGRAGQSEAAPLTNSLAHALQARARAHPHRRALTFLADGESESANWSYAELDARARAVAAQLKTRGAHGERVALLLPGGPEYVAALFGCFYAGAIAVPLYPPRPNRADARIEAVIAACQPKFAFTNAAILSRLAPDARLQWLTLDWNSGADAAISAHEIAFLQYTSGSTSAPKGVMVSHANVAANAAMIGAAFGQTEDFTIVSWLPLFHDMGLIGALLQGVLAGNHVVLMPPETFLMKPLRWLRAISKYRAHASGAPNFAYDLCARKIAPEQCEDLDLRGWKLAFCGAEPVRAATLRAFALAFAPFGFSDNALYPCYGLAEATLFAAGGDRAHAPTIAHFNAAALEDKRARLSDAADARALVGCGHGWNDAEIRSVDPASRQPCAPGAIGEIWLRGPHVARGYWNGDNAAFEAKLDGDAAPWLATGDLGFVHQNELFVVGRLKDLIIVAGRNHACHDIEATVSASHPAIRAGGCAAFGIETNDGEALAIVAEIERTALAHLDTDAVIAALRRAVAAHHDLRVHTIQLVRFGALPRTSSGKLQRHRCREMLMAGTLDGGGES